MFVPEQAEHLLVTVMSQVPLPQVCASCQECTWLSYPLLLSGLRLKGHWLPRHVLITPGMNASSSIPQPRKSLDSAQNQRMEKPTPPVEIEVGTNHF